MMNIKLESPITTDKAQMLAQKYARTKDDIPKLFNLFLNKGISERHYLEAVNYYRQLNPKSIKNSTKDCTSSTFY